MARAKVVKPTGDVKSRRLKPVTQVTAAPPGSRREGETMTDPAAMYDGKAITIIHIWKP